MKKLSLSIVILILFCSLYAQEVAIIYDGSIGIYPILKSDTLYIDDIVKNSSADLEGLQRGDRVIEIDEVQVSGAGMSLREIENHLQKSAGETVCFKVMRNEVDTFLLFRITRSLNISREHACYFEYLVDSAGHLTIHDILTDSINRLFSSPVENKMLVHSVMKDSKAEKMGLKPGDRIMSLYGALDPYWDMIEFIGKPIHDTSITIIRDGNNIILPVHKKKKSFSGVLSKFGYDCMQHCCWYKVRLNNRISEDKPYLMDFWPNDSISLYEVSENKIISEKKSGRLLHGKDKDYLFKKHNYIKVNLTKNQEQTLYIRITNDEIVIWNPFIYIVSGDYITRFDRIERFIIASLYGMMLILALYYLILYTFVKENSYILYFFFIISFGLALLNDSGYGTELIWPDSTYFFDKIEYVLVALPFTFFLLFGIAYLDLYKLKKIWFKIIIINLVIIWIPLLLFVFRNLQGLSTYFMNTLSLDDVLELIMGIGLISVAIILLVPAILRIREGFKPAWYFLIANILFLIVIGYFAVSSGANQIHSDFSKALYHANTHLGVALQFLVFAFGLGSKIRTSERDKKEAQERIIEQLKENEKLKDKVNRELEEKVRERTEEIFQQKEEIETQRDELEKQRDLLTLQKQEITDSIIYAKKIQSAVLPPEEMLDKILPEHFILFRPRDIVSGDFYWVRQIKNYTVVVAADCTGHGVPGAFMSMLGMTLLNEQISKSKFDQAGELLNRMRIKVKETLKQEGREKEQRDGMDMALAIVNNDNFEMQFAGAYNPLYIIRKKDNKTDPEDFKLSIMESAEYYLLEIKGDRQPIGVYYDEADFKTNYCKIKHNDTLYIFSDGYADQMGGPRGKKFMSRKFKEMLLQIQNEPMSMQKDILNIHLDNWKGNLEQIDDILVIGIRWN